MPVEAEGLTLVNGKLATNGAKTSWSSNGFRFGVVGFGAQFRPQSGSDVLVVAGNSTSNTSNSTGNMWDADNPSKSVSALGGFDNGSTGCAFVQNEGTGNNVTWYSARINGNTSWHLNADKNSSGSNAGRSVWDATATVDADGNKYTNVKFDSVGLNSVKLNDATKDYSTFYADTCRSVQAARRIAKERGRVCCRCQGWYGRGIPDFNYECDLFGRLLHASPLQLRRHEEQNPVRLQIR